MKFILNIYINDLINELFFYYRKLDCYKKSGLINKIIKMFFKKKWKLEIIKIKSQIDILRRILDNLENINYEMGRHSN